ncbi:MAG TPA: glycoside hydrolase family 9 protein, partial [Clostridia bacterium]|nr:glycoside hydrolase family 9 protein [Clostridia bacterium]
MDRFRLLTLVVVLCLNCACSGRGANERLTDESPLKLPSVGAYQLRVLTPQVLELSLITTKSAEGKPAGAWDFVNDKGHCRLPDTKAFAVSAGGKTIPVQSVGFRRYVLYAPLKERDLRIANHLYLVLETPIPGSETVLVRNPDGKLWPQQMRYEAKCDPHRWSPVLHVNQTGYLPAQPKKAMVGYYLGSLGELSLAPSKTNDQKSSASSLSFELLDARSKKEVYRGTLKVRPEKGFTFDCYQKVWEADFSAFTTPGEYCLHVPGVGSSFPFLINEAVAGAFARTSALGLYHQRCGTENTLPFTRFTHKACHTTPAEVPDATSKFEAAEDSLAKESSNWKDNPRHTAPQLKSVTASLYPFVKPEPVDVRGGHHDAGDYSKYTINSAAFIHHLVFAADAFSGVSQLDNLGLPESGDGKSDVLQEAKWEADFLAKMQDADGGFYFLVYPRGREYENDVLPDQGDPQVVFPKNTAATAAATAALAQCASSPVFKKQFPDAARVYLNKAKKGWAFLERAMAKHGKDAAYQKISHYGDEFMHDDELAWAACELFVATGDPAYHKKLKEWLDPADPQTRRWGWWRLYEAYGCAIRSYAFAARSGKLKREALNPLLLEQCESEIVAAGEEQMQRAHHSAYGTSFPDETKRTRSAGWYFSSDAAFDLTVAYHLDYPSLKDPRPRLLEAIISNLNYEQGCNPVNVTYVTGLGW